jgi:hypothetical protein
VKYRAVIVPSYKAMLEGNMGLIAKVAQIDRKFSWSFLGFVLAAIFGGIAIYTESPDLRQSRKYEFVNRSKRFVY